MIGIYKIINPNGRVNVGQSNNVERRFNEYKSLHNCKYQVILFRSFIKYGIDNHIFEIIEECNIDNLNERERYWQEYYNVLEEGLNCVLTNTDNKIRTLSKEYKNKISNTLKLKYESKEIINFRKGKGRKYNIYNFKGDLLYSNIDASTIVEKFKISNRSVINVMIRSNRFILRKEYIVCPADQDYLTFITNCIKNTKDGNYIPVYQIYSEDNIVKNTRASNQNIRSKLFYCENYVYYSKKNKSYYTFIGLVNAVLESNF